MKRDEDAENAAADEPEATDEADERDEDDQDDEPDAEPAPALRPAAAPPATAAPRATAAPGKGWPREVVVLGMVLSGLAGALVMTTLPEWSPGLAARLGKAKTIELTLVATDRANLACASAATVDGLRCAFDAEGKPWPAGAGPSDPAATLQPYTTSDRKLVLAAGLWEDPAMDKAKLPSTRFRARCDFVPAGEASAKIRWTKGAFKDAAGPWPAGRLSNCTVLGG